MDEGHVTALKGRTHRWTEQSCNVEVFRANPEPEGTSVAEDCQNFEHARGGFYRPQQS